MKLFLKLLLFYFCLINLETSEKKILDEKKTDFDEFDPAKHSLVYYGYLFTPNRLDDDKLLVNLEWI